MYIEKNITHLSQHPYHWIAPMDEPMFPHFKATEPNGDTYFEREDGTIIKLTDKLDNTYKSRVTHKEILFIFGVHAVNEIKHLYKTKNRDSLVIVIEPTLSFFSSAFVQKNLSVLGNDNILLFADNDITNLVTFLQPVLHEINYAKLLKKINFYFTAYYRAHDTELLKQCVAIIRQTVTGVINSYGNDVEDSLIGLEHNLQNIKYILKSKDTILLKDKFKQKPAIVVAAGPSLNKNIHELKKAQGKVVIIAVDTIINRLLNEGIIPDFICSIERLPEVYEYFYKEQKIPEQITLVGPAVLDNRIFKEYKGNILIPFRNEVNETAWLQQMFKLPKESGIAMGSSCAHVAFGLADHLGCSPIILVGQDLAYGENEGETHASGTTYDAEAQKPKPTEKRDQDLVEGYYGNEVVTTKIWIQFKVWFEKRIGQDNLHVIDATEGGARIFLTERMTLKETIETYCKHDIISPTQLIEQIPVYPIDILASTNKFKQQVNEFTQLIEDLSSYFEQIEEMEISNHTFMKQARKLEYIHTLIKRVFDNKILFHNLQSVVLRYLWELHSREQIINLENVKLEKNEQIKLLAVMSRTIYEVRAYIEEAIKQIQEDE